MTRRQPDQYDWANCEFDELHLPASPRRTTVPRRQKISGICIHHMAMVGKGEAALTACSNAWKTREASAHYGVADEFIRQYVWDNEEAWATANSMGNQTTISIEHANTTGAATWEVGSKTWHTSARLVANLHVLYKLGRPRDNVTLWQHNDFYATACPGPYLGKKIWNQYVAEVQRLYDEIKGDTSTPKPPPTVELPKPVELSDSRILELSGIVLSVANPGHYWAINDENGPIWLVRITDGAIVGSFILDGVTLVDPEALAIDYAQKTLKVLDAGNNDGKRTKGAIYTLPEPVGAKHHGKLHSIKTSFAIPDKANFEAFVVHPKTGVTTLVSKADAGHFYRLSGTTLKKLAVGAPSLVSDACFSPTGENVFFVRKGVDMVVVYDADLLKWKGSFPHPDQPQPEAIGLHPNGAHVMVGSEGKKSKLLPVKIPAEFI